MEFLKTGIASFDAATGGIPKGTRTILYGGSGTGKTIFGMQFLWTGLQNGECVACNVMDRPFDYLRNYFRSFEWDTSRFEKSGKFIGLQSFHHFDDFPRDPRVTYFTADDVDGLREVTLALSKKGVHRMVSGDSSQTVFSLIPSRRMIPIGNWMVNWAFHSGVTILDVVTATQVDAEGHKNWSLSLKAAHNVIQFRQQNGRREIRILKMEGAEHPLDWLPMEITARGIEVGVS